MLKTEKVEVVDNHALESFLMERLDCTYIKARDFVMDNYWKHDKSYVCIKLGSVLECSDEFNQVLGKEMLSKGIVELYLLF